jgi:hypothetical protein
LADNTPFLTKKIGVFYFILGVRGRRFYDGSCKILWNSASQEKGLISKVRGIYGGRKKGLGG